MRVGIVGAGIAGLAAARRLQSKGAEAVVFEISDDVGGRIATEQIGPYTFDTGATDLAPGSFNLAVAMLNELDTTDLVRIEKPIYTHVSLRVAPGDATKNKLPRYTYRKGNEQLPHLLAQGLDVRLGLGIGALERVDNDRYAMAGETFDALVLTPPVPQSASLLTSLGESRPLANTFYRSTLAVMLGYDRALPDIPYHALLDPEQRHPLTWLSVESVKCPGRAPEGHTAFVAQLGPQYSSSNFGAEADTIVASTVGHLARLYGPEWAHPAVSGVRRWRYAQPETYALFETVNQPGTRLILAGDGVLGARVEFAYEAGIRAADLLLD